MSRVVAIDGPAGAGKSTVARAVAERLGLEVLDTGAMYRALTVAVLRAGVDPQDATRVAALAEATVIEVGERVLVDGTDATAAIRTPEVDAHVSTVAANPGVRAVLVERQRRWVADRGGGVVEGRDIGTVVFPEATVKVFLDADPEVRARRRYADEAVARPGVDAARVGASLRRRDRLDSTRSVAPLQPAPDALVIDTTGRSVEDVVEEILRRVRETEPGGGGRR